MRNIGAGMRAIMAGRQWRVFNKVWIEDPDGLMRDVTAFHGANWFEHAEWGEHADQATASGTITLLREDLDLGISLAPAIGASLANRNALGAYAPFLKEGRQFWITTAVKDVGQNPIDADYFEVMRGYIDTVRQSSDQNEMRLDFRDPGAALLDFELIDSHVYADNDAGMLAEDIIQASLDDIHGAGAYNLYVPVPSATVLRNIEIGDGKHLERLRDVAFMIGWDLRYRYDPTGLMRLTFFEPRRDFDPDTDAPDTLFAKNEYTAIPRLDIGVADVRNLIRVGFRNVATGQRDHVDVSDAASIAAYRMRFMELNFADEGNINTVDEATVVANAALNDLSTPYSDHDATTIPFYWPAQVGDIYEFEQNGITYDSNQIFGVVGYSHVLGPDGGETSFATKGKVVGAIKEWKRRSRVVLGPSDAIDIADVPIRLRNFHEKGRTPISVTYAWENDVRTAEIWIWALTYDQPVPQVPDPRPTIDTPNPIRLTAATTEYTFAIPVNGKITYALVVPFDADWNHGDAEEPTLHPLDAIPIFDNFRHDPGVDGLHRDASFSILDPGGKGGTLRAWTNHDAADDANPDVAVEGTYAVPATPATVGPLTVFALTAGGTSNLLDEIRVHPGRGKRITVEFINSDNISSGKQSFVMLSAASPVDQDNELIAQIIKNTTPFASAVKPVTMYASLPGAGLYVGQVAFQTSDNQLYRWNGSSWTHVVNAPDMVGQVITTQIADAAINAQKIADAAVETAKIAVGAIDAARIGDAAVTTVKIALLAVTSAILAAGAVTTTKITDDAVTTPKLVAGAVTTSRIAAGAVTANEIAALTITAGNIAAGAITAAKIAAHTITANEILALTITAAEIAAGTITGGKIAANTITAGNIAALTITASEIAANTITGAKIAADTITSIHIAAGAIESGELAANAVIAGKIAAGVVSTTELAADAVTAAKIAAGAVTAGKISVSTLGSINQDVGVILAGKLQNAGGTQYLDLNASGTQGFLVHPKIVLRANGNGEFSGDVILDSSSIYFRNASINRASMSTYLLLGGGPPYITLTGFETTVYGYTSGSAAMRWYYYQEIARGTLEVGGDVIVHNDLAIYGNVGFYNTAPVSRPTVTGYAGGNAALTSLLGALSGLGLIIDSSS